MSKINLPLVAVFYFALFLFSFWMDSLHPVFKFPKFGDDFLRTILCDGLFGVCVAGFVCLASLLLSIGSKSLAEISKGLAQFIGPLGYSEIFFLSFFSSMGEEFFFRGFLFAKVGLFASSLLFGLLHVGPSRKYWPWTVFAVLMGFALGALYDWRNNLLLPVTIHFAVNFFNLGMMQRYYGPGKSYRTSNTPQ